MNDHKKHPFDEMFLFKTVSACIQEYGYHFKATDIITMLVSTGVIQHEKNSQLYVFGNVTYLAYFTARSILQDYQEFNTDEKIIEVIQQ